MRFTTMTAAIRKYLSLVKFSHTVFAMPFAAIGFVMGGLYDASGINVLTGFKVLLCMVFARNAAMAFNRYADAHLDTANARTAIREIPAGILSRKHVGIFVILNAVAFMAVAWWINTLCFALSPVALLVILGYSYTKRFTPLCHLILGVGLSLAPIGAFLAVTGVFFWPVIVLGAGVMCWVGGFDIIYALQDERFDQEHTLHSIPAWLGGERALGISRLLHFSSAGLIWLFVYLTSTHFTVFLPAMVVAALLFTLALMYQQRLVSPDDLSRVNLAFFTTNGISSIAFGVLVIVGLLV